MNEKELAARLAKGDTKALGEIIEMFDGYVHTVAYNFSRGTFSAQDIDDIAADVFCRLWEHRADIKAEIGLRSYLSASARNAVKDRFKAAPPLSEDISELQLPSDYMVEDTAELNEMISCLYEGLKTLPKEDREIFFRFYFNGEKSSRIAKAKGATKGAIDTRLYRVRNKLREYLSERGFDHV